MPINTPVYDIQNGNYEGVVISGGPDSVNEKGHAEIDPELLNSGIPVLGICYGAQVIAHLEGIKVSKEELREDGKTTIYTNKNSLLFKDLSSEQEVLLTHGDSISCPSYIKNFRVSAISENGVVTAIEDSKRKIYGVQFHPEITDITKHGLKIFDNFLEHVVESKRGYDIGGKETETVTEIKNIVGDKNVLILVSGGVDSTVTTALLSKSLKSEQIYAVHIDNGLMREKESQEVSNTLQGLGINLTVYDRTDEFLNGRTTINGNQTDILSKEIDPQTKRLIIGDTFINIYNEIIGKLNLDPENTILCQGTLRPDLIESGSHIASGRAAVIKTHHNDTDLVRKLRNEKKVIEPLKEFYKDDVRIIGKNLGLSETMIWRQPFPGPGLGIRVICASEPYICKDFENTNKELKKIVKGTGLNATLMPMRTVGVQGDGRTYNYPAILSGEDNWDRIFYLATEITNKLPNINRVVYSLGKKIKGPLTQITPTYIEKPVLSQLKDADSIVTEILSKYKLNKKLSQVPVILFPVNFGNKGERGIAIRPFITNDFMTGIAAKPGSDYMPLIALQEIFKKITTEVKGISRVLYDVTSKPPGTIEWE